MLRVVKQEVLEFIIPGGTKKWIILREVFQDVLELLVMHKTEIPRINDVKDVQSEGIKLRTNI